MLILILFINCCSFLFSLLSCSVFQREAGNMTRSWLYFGQFSLFHFFPLTPVFLCFSSKVYLNALFLEHIIHVQGCLLLEFAKYRKLLTLTLNVLSFNGYMWCLLLFCFTYFNLICHLFKLLIILNAGLRLATLLLLKAVETYRMPLGNSSYPAVVPFIWGRMHMPFKNKNGSPQMENTGTVC